MLRPTDTRPAPGWIAGSQVVAVSPLGGARARFVGGTGIARGYVIMKTPEISVVCPLFNERDNVGPLVDAVASVLGDRWPWEFVLVDDGSSDDTVAIAGARARADTRVRVVRLARNYGQATATQAGFDVARGGVIVTLDGDLQNDPADIPMLLEKLGEGYDLVAGYREERKDRFMTRTLPSRVANLLIRSLTGVPIRDNGCSLKAYRRELVERLGLYSDMHRFIPALAVGTAGARIAQVPVRHHPRRFGRSKYGLSRVWKVLADLMTVIMLRWFRDRPLLLFALGSLAALGVGLLFTLGSIVMPLSGAPGAQAVVLPGAAILLIGLSLYLLMVGLIAEVAIHRAAGTRTPFARELGRRP